MREAFSQCSNLKGHATDTPNLSKVTNMEGMFRNAENFNQDLGAWNVSNVTNMSYMFDGASSFNQDLSAWDVSKVTDMSWMFSRAKSFNQPLNWEEKVAKVTNMSYMFSQATNFDQNISAWNVSKVTDMTLMFADAESFNQDISTWNVSNVTFMGGMFSRATSFNQNISAWNVSNVTNTDGMFLEATSFNQDISTWNVSNVISMQSMFLRAESFNQDISAWNVSNVIYMDFIFQGVTLSTKNYDALLKEWSSLALQNGVKFHGGNSSFCKASDDRAKIIADFNWTIIDNGENCHLNDDFNSAILVDEFPYTNTQNAQFATGDFLACGNSPNLLTDGLWYAFKGTNSDIKVTVSANWAMQTGIYTLDANNKLQCETTMDNKTNPKAILNIAQSDPNKTYYLNIGNDSHSSVPDVFNVLIESKDHPFNDDFNTAILVDDFPYTNAQNAQFATGDFFACGDSPNLLTDGLWYAFKGTSNNIKVTVSANWAMQAGIFTLDANNELQCETTMDNKTNPKAILNIAQSDPNKTYYLNIGNDSHSSVPDVFNVLIESSIGPGIGPSIQSRNLFSSPNINSNEISVYPNPTNNKLFVTSKQPIDHITIYSIHGALIGEVNNDVIDVSLLANGMYLLKIKTNTGTTTKRFIKK
ncbi:BspA family leucine-rich repeat surface protein [Flavivirga eckloniae]|uniref:Secretion system C-terminal sorting domain-containing protein n=1 Tax=Flavivirga eckloniae TaxID=1803846 RepID=A0A2K9PV54_9FLAO|nr:BspA family leucine-rich repeat surface protein [Flavivirga eckloniae]AUP80939.1 hypothetical protein C1H87_20385 [Flavivirga eckloniae]